MKIAILTKEFPPYIYGGAGVHVDYLTRALARLDRGEHDVHVLCFGDQKGTTRGRRVTSIQTELPIETYDNRHQRFLETLIKDAAMVGALREADIIHCHTWYTHLAGCLLKQMLGAPLVLTTHSLEAHRPWKEEQLGSAYYASSWLE
ncbi:MAG: glycosyltransferase, partial [Pseudomonadota bacterium]